MKRAFRSRAQRRWCRCCTGVGASWAGEGACCTGVGACWAGVLLSATLCSTSNNRQGLTHTFTGSTHELAGRHVHPCDKHVDGHLAGKGRAPLHPVQGRAREHLCARPREQHSAPRAARVPPHMVLLGQVCFPPASLNPSTPAAEIENTGVQGQDCLFHAVQHCGTPCL